MNVHSSRLFAVMLVFVLFVAGVFGIFIYFTSLWDNGDVEISQPDETANIATALGCKEIGQDYFYRAPWPYNYLYITGTVSNAGNGTAYNAGLKVVAYNSTGSVLVDMTFPLGNVTFGTTPEISAYLKQYSNIDYSLALGIDGKWTK